MGGLLKRYRELLVVVVLLVAPLGLYFAHAKHPSERSRLDRSLLWVSGPIERATEWVAVKALDIWHGYIALRHAHERANDLQRAMGELELDRLELQRVRLENERLRLLLGFAEPPSGRSLVGARVIGVRFDPKGLQVVTISRGASAGLAEMMPVVVGHGVVGRIHAVSETTADVLLLSDRNSSIAVLVERTRARANVRGTGSPDTCRLEYALRSDDFTEGDVLVTSGTDGVFPRGLPVGTLVNLKRSGQGLYQKADVRPAVDVTKLEELLVITKFDRRPPPEPVAVTSSSAGANAPGAQKPAPSPGAVQKPGAPAAKAAPARAAVPASGAAAVPVKAAAVKPGVVPAKATAPVKTAAPAKAANAPANATAPVKRPANGMSAAEAPVKKGTGQAKRTAEVVTP